MKLCEGRDICKHEKCFHYMPHEHCITCTCVTCRRPGSEPKTKSKCVVIESVPIFTPMRKLRPYGVEESK